ncbi:MAG: mechanosensitive ion channel [Bacteroidales bacterium]|jgi:small conductance mechanosensitive channel|nr:mechanosensitive ion channel [Bacteroidales bacterium]
MITSETTTTIVDSTKEVSQDTVGGIVKSTVETVQHSINMIGELQHKGLNLLMDYVPKIIIAALLLWIGLKLTNFICKRIKAIMTKRNVDVSLIPFIVQVISIALKILIIITVISIVGIQMTSFIALLGAMGLAIGMAFSGTLSNVAGGVVILVLKTFRVGDYIAAQGYEGTVKSIQIFTTTLTTVDNKIISIPNGALSTGTIINYSVMDTRRQDINIKLAHGSNTNQIAKDILDIVKQDSRILRDNEPVVLTNITESSITLDVRLWTKAEDYWDVNADMNEKIYNYLYDNKIDVPIPKL